MPASFSRAAQHNEYEEHDDIYQKFGNVAKEEGFSKVAFSFHQIAEIEKVHGDRFGRFAELVEQKKLFVSDTKIVLDLPEMRICLQRLGGTEDLPRMRT